MTTTELFIKTLFPLLGLRKGPDKAPPFDPKKIKRILVVRNDNLGDLILTIPAIRALRQTFPDAFLAVLVHSYTLPVVEGLPWIDKIYSYVKYKHDNHPTRFHAWLEQYRLHKELQRQHFDLAVGIRSEFSPSQGLLIYASAAPWRLGLTPTKKGKDRAFFYNIIAPMPSEEKHEVERSLDLVRTIGADTANKELEFFIPPDRKQQIKNWISQQGINKPIIGIQITQRVTAGRVWAAEKYVKLINSVQDEGVYTPVLIFAPSDSNIANILQQQIENKIITFSSSDLKLFAALLNACALLITLEGGAMHIATAVDTKTIAIFGKTNTNVWHPWGNKHIALKKSNQENDVQVEEVLDIIHRSEINCPTAS